MQSITVYLAGSGRGNVGAWASTLLCGKHRKQLIGSETPSSSQRAFILAAICSLRALKKLGMTVELKSDSAYLVDGATGQTKTKANADLWTLLRVETAKHTVTFTKLSGFSYSHTGSDCIERAKEAMVEAEIARDCPEEAHIFLEEHTPL